ncbi:MAG: hypothetical protein AB7U29_06345 [Desulfobulbus sp.]
MFACRKTHHHGKGKQGKSRGEYGRQETACRRRGGGQGRGSERGLQPLLQEENTSVSTTASIGGTCPLCKKHCSLNDPGCPKGEAFAQSLTRRG